MTTIRLDNRAGISAQADKHYIQLPSVKIACKVAKELTRYNDPRTTVDTGSETVVLDLHSVAHTYSITGLIDDSCEYTNSGYGTKLSVAEAALTLDAITNMSKNGGTVLLTLGTTSDGYSITRTFEVQIADFTWEEVAEDEPVCKLYSFSMTLLEAVDL